MGTVIYKDLKDRIIKSCKPEHDCDCGCEPSMMFEVDLEKLTTLVADMKLIPVAVNLKCKPILPKDIPFLSEYFEKEKLRWLSRSKFYTVLTFVDSEEITDECKELIDLLAKDDMSDPSNDKTKDMAKLVANYRCYFATIVSYQNNDPNKMDTPFYEIICRANKVIIKSSDYQYNYKDFT